MHKIDQNIITGRWSIALPDEEGRPVIEADTPEALESLFTAIEENTYRQSRGSVLAGGS